MMLVKLYLGLSLKVLLVPVVLVSCCPFVSH
uniref:Uncharacterized protein n=1 Tax=Arundo donax TaxID=35708 RepID=A0A0A9HR84_ARUDO